MENFPLEQRFQKNILSDKEEAMNRLRVLEKSFSVIASDNSLTESEFYSKRFPIDGEIEKILDEYPDLRTWYENEL